MTKPIVQPIKRADPNVRKLARALLMLVEQQQAVSPQPKRRPQRKAS